MSLHSFDPDIATRVGVNAAVIYQNLIFWTKKNKADRRHIKDGYVWSYNSRRALSELFPYLTQNQIKTAIAKLVDCGLVLKGEYSLKLSNKSNWYAPAESAKWLESPIGEKTPMHQGENTNALVENHQSTTDSKPHEKPNTKNLTFSQDAGASSEGENKLGLWREGVPVLASLGMSTRSARSAIGKWCKTYGTDAISQAIDQAKESGTGDPVAYVTRTLEPLKKKTTFELACELNDKGPAFNAKW